MSTQDELPQVADHIGSDDEHELHPGEERFRRLFQSMPLPAYAWQRRGDDFKLTDYNNAASEITHGAIGEFVGKTATEMYPDRPDIVEDISRCFAEKASFRREMDYAFKSTGEDKKLVVQYAYVPSDLVLVQTEDVTELQKSLEEASFERDLMQSILDTSLDTIVVFEPHTLRYLKWNKAVVQITGYSDEEFPTLHPIETFFDEAELPRVEAAVEELLREGTVTTTATHINKDGSRTPLEYTASVSKDTEGETQYLIFIGRDITERILLEEALRKSEAMYRDLVENISDVLYAIDSEGLVTYVSPAVEPLLGFPPERFIGQPFAQYVVPEDLDRVADNIQQLISGYAPGPNEYRVKTASDEIRWIRVSSRPTFSEGRITGLQGVMTDITAVKRAEEQLEKSAAIAERRRLARELHDSATQTLYSISLYSNATKESLNAGKIDTAIQHTDVIQNLSQSALADMRLLIFEMQPQILIEKGLAKALRERLDLVEARAGYNTSLRVTSEEPIPQVIEAELYAIATEALNNTLKHAQAEQVNVILDVDEHAICLEISDNGLGFNPEASDISEGFGLSSMRDRTERLEGSFILKSTPGEGTTVRAEVPV